MNDNTIVCPECNSESIEYDDKAEYTGGGFLDEWTVFECQDCFYQWKSGSKSQYR